MPDIYPLLAQFAAAHPVPEAASIPSWANECGTFIAESGRSIDPTFTITGLVTSAYQAWLSSLHGQLPEAVPWCLAFFKNKVGNVPGHVGWIDADGYLISATTTNAGTLLAPGTPYLRRMTLAQYEAAHPERELVGFADNYGGAKISPSIMNDHKGGSHDMNQHIIKRDDGNLYVFDYAAETYRVAGGGEAYCLNAEAAAGLIIIQPVSDATMASLYPTWKALTAPIDPVAQIETAVATAVAGINIPAATVTLTTAQLTTLTTQLSSALAKVIPTATAITAAVVAGVKKIVVKTTLS